MFMKARSARSYTKHACLPALAGVVMLALAPSCSDNPSTGLLLAITSDLDVQYSIDAVGLSIENQKTVVISTVNPIKDGNKFVVFFPATLVLFPPDDGEATVRIRAVAYYQNNARIIRQAIVSVPRDHLRLLRLPLNWGNQIPQGTAQPAESYLLPQQLVDGCGETETRINGVCAPSKVDGTKLPICADSSCSEVLRSRKNVLDNITCFSSPSCFPTACSSSVTPLFEREGDTCRYRYRGPAGADVKRLNFALKLPDTLPSTAPAAATFGQCADRIAHTGCFAAIARNPETQDPTEIEGWKLEGDLASGVITLPPWACSHASDPGTSLISSFGCDAIYTDMMPCGETLSFSDPISFQPACVSGSDAGADASTNNDGSVNDASSTTSDASDAASD